METGENRIQEKIRHSKARVSIHLSWNPLEKRPERSALHWFKELNIGEQEGVLIYLNLRRRSCAIVPATSLLKRLNPIFWKRVLHSLTEDLQCTHHENALLMAIETIDHSFSISDKHSLN